MGIAEITPGISGATIAGLFNVYKDFVNFLNVFNVKLFWKYDNINAPTTPRDAASVAVAIPVYIDPITANIKIITGKSCFDLFIFSKNEYSSIIFGIDFVLIKDQMIT